MMQDTIESQFVEPRPVPPHVFPESTWTAEGMRVLEADPTPRHGMVILGVEYAHKSGRPLHLQIIQPPMELPANPFEIDTSIRFPLVVFVQGSAWQEQFLGQSLLPLAEFAARGYVVAIVEYRPSPVAVFPAQIKDAKSAIRFLRTHADEYHIDPDRVVLWGDSSGAHTTVLTYLTENEQEYSDEAVNEPLGVSCYVDFYGPTDISRMNEEPSIQNHLEPDSPEGQLIGRRNVLEHPELVAPTIAMNHIGSGRPLKPLLIIHGNKDRLVPFAQSVLLYESLVAAGQPVEFYQLKGADHGGPAFWTRPVLDIVEDFIQGNLDGGSQ